ncbi:MAG: helix-turn-helix transcriptional regulator [Spirochaetales bacterium]|nr:helix-turn-helix transcriptional regulator [Spirochaetales bacterium]
MSSPRKGGRHTPAFILLFLAENPSYGSGLLKKMESALPFCLVDSAGLYRALQNLEKDGAVSGSWETPDSGGPKKIYRITPAGAALLAELAKDIERRQENFRVFLEHWNKVSPKEPGQESS